MGVEPQRHDQRVAAEKLDPFQPSFKRGEEAFVAGAPIQGQVQVRTLARSAPALMGMAPEERIEPRRVRMRRHGQHLRIVVEDALRAIAVVHVDVEDCRTAAGAQQRLGCDGGVVEETETARHVGEGVMPRRTAERVDHLLARQHRLGAAHRTLRRKIGRGPGVRPDGTGGVGHVPACLAHHAVGVADPVAIRMHVGHDFFRGAVHTLPARVNVLQKRKVFRRMHVGDEADTVILGH